MAKNHLNGITYQKNPKSLTALRDVSGYHRMTCTLHSFQLNCPIGRIKNILLYNVVQMIGWEMCLIVIMIFKMWSPKEGFDFPGVPR